MKGWHTESTDRLIRALASVKTVQEGYDLMEDLCTIKEIIDMAQRFEVATLLTQGKNYQQIAKQTGVSTATISRVNKSLSYGNGGYQIVFDRLNINKDK